MPLSTSDSLLIGQIRKRIDFEYQSALIGLEHLESLLADDGNDAIQARSVIRALANRISIRQVVLAQIVDSFASVKEIAERTGLSQQRIRGVLYSRQVMKFLTRDRVAGGFKIKEADFAKHFQRKRKAPVRDSVGHGLARTK